MLKSLLLTSLIFALLFPAAHTASAKIDRSAPSKKSSHKKKSKKKKGSNTSLKFAGKFSFTQKGKVATKCTKISQWKSKELAKDKTCKPFKDSLPAIPDAIVQCGKKGRKTIYIFDTPTACADGSKAVGSEE